MKRTRKAHKENMVGPWAEEKLNALREYLNYYTTVLKNQKHWDKIFIDAFAGPGLSRVRRSYEDDGGLSQLLLPDLNDDSQEVTFIKGSPIVALELKVPFDRYVFIDQDAARVTELTNLTADYRNERRIDIVNADANEELMKLASGISKFRHRAVAFLDPYGVNIYWDTIAALAKTGATEIMINFPWSMAINRLLVKSGELPENWRIMLDRFFGDEEWHRLVYSKTQDLFGETSVKTPDAGNAVLEYYTNKLEKYFGFVSSPYLIQNTSGNPLYYLIWAGPNELGLKGAEYILKKGNKIKFLRGGKR